VDYVDKYVVYVLILLVLIFVPLKVIRLPIFCNESSVCATFGSTDEPDVLESRVGESATLCECHRRSGYENLASEISFPETRRIRKLPIQASEDLWRPEPYFGDQKFPLLLLGGEQLKHKLREDSPHIYVFYNSLACSHERPNLTATWESVTSAIFDHFADIL
jgi:hypothetical protein